MTVSIKPSGTPSEPSASKSPLEGLAISFDNPISPEGYWDNRYRSKPFASGKEPSKFLQQMLPRLRRGRVLDIAMGEGVNATFLAQKGYDVKGFDFSAEALAHAAELAKEAGVIFDAKRIDMDLVLFKVMENDSIIMTLFKPSVPRYYSEMVRSLKQGGTLLIESYLIDEMTEGIGKNEAYKNFYFFPNELLNHLRDLRILYYHEGMIDGRHRVQCLAMKPLDKDAVKYGLFDMHVKQKEVTESPQLKMAEAFFKKKE